MTVGRSAGSSTESYFVVVGALAARASSCCGSHHIGRDHHQVAVKGVHLVGLALGSLQASCGPADANLDLLGDAQLQHHMSPCVIVVR